MKFLGHSVFSFTGRVNRKPYIYMRLMSFAILFVIGMITGVLSSPVAAGLDVLGTAAGGWIYMIIKLLSTIAMGMFALCMVMPESMAILVLAAVGIVYLLFGIVIPWTFEVRRLHDLGFCGWWLLLTFIPIVSLVAWIGEMFVKGNAGANKFGEDPLA